MDELELITESEECKRDAQGCIGCVFIVFFICVTIVLVSIYGR